MLTPPGLHVFRVGALRILALEHKLMEQVVVLRSQREFLATGLPLSRTSSVPRTSAAPFSVQQQRPQRHDCRLGRAPSAASILLGSDVIHGLPRRARRFAPFEQSLRRHAGSLHAGACAGRVNGGFVSIPPGLLIFLSTRVEQKLHGLARELSLCHDLRFHSQLRSWQRRPEYRCPFSPFMCLSTYCLAFSTAGP